MLGTNKLISIILLTIPFIGCNQSKSRQSGIEKHEFLMEEFDTIAKTRVEEFSEQLKNEKIVDLPYLLNSDILLPYEIIQPIEDTISATSSRSPNELNNLDKYFKLINVNGLDQVLYEDIALIEPSFNSLFHKRFKPFNDSIEVLLMSSNLSDSQVNIWFVLTFDFKNKETIDNAIVGVFRTYADTYYESYFRIEKNYTFKSIFSSSYETRPLYRETDFSIAPNGSITTLRKQEYSYEDEDNLQSYSNYSGNYEVIFYEDSYDDGTPTFNLRYYKNNNSTYDSLLVIEEPISLLDNKNRKWLTVYNYKEISWVEKSAHYRRYFYNSNEQINRVQEVKYHNINDSILSIAFKNARSDIEIDEIQYIEFEYYLYGHSLFEPWSNSIFDLNSYNEVKTKLTYLK